MRFQLMFLLPLLNLTPVAFAAGPASQSQGDPVTLSAPVGLADHVLAETSSAAEAARRWLRENLSNEAVSGMAQDAQDAAIRKFNSALEEARLAHEQSLGLFVFAPGEGKRGEWKRVAADTVLPSRVVLLVHGLDEGGTIWDNVAPALAGADYAVARFNYPNDQPIRSSADRLVESLRELSERGVSSVDIIGHSMGGLVARDALTRPEHYRGDARGGGGLPAIARFIMLATPNQGSPLARLRGVMEVRDQFVRWTRSENKLSSGLLGCMVDGCGEAGADLSPGSSFLVELNNRPQPSHVSITIITGSIAQSTRERITSAFENPYVRRVIGAERCDRWKCGADGVGNEVGDGVVPASSAALDGVTDVVNVPADHRSMIRVIEPVEATRDALGIENPTPPAIPVILDRLARPAAK